MYDAPATAEEQRIADLDALLHHFRLTRAQLIGRAEGAVIAAKWAARHLDANTDRIVFIDPPLPMSAVIAERLHALPNATLLVRSEPGHDSTAGRDDVMYGTIDAYLRR